MAHRPHRGPRPTRPSVDGPVAMEAVAKLGGGMRLLARLSPDDDAVFSRATLRAARAIERALGPESFGNRAVRAPSGRLELEAWHGARARYRRAIAHGAALAAGGVVTFADVRECYRSIEPRIVRRRLEALGCSAYAIDGIAACLLDLDALGVEGLAAGPVASAVIANAVLSEVDDAIRVARLRHVRWVDDFVLFSPSRREAAGTLDVVRRALVRVGLELHEGKTVVVAAGEARAALGSRACSGEAAPLR